MLLLLDYNDECMLSPMLAMYMPGFLKSCLGLIFLYSMLLGGASNFIYKWLFWILAASILFESEKRPFADSMGWAPTDELSLLDACWLLWVMLFGFVNYLFVLYCYPSFIRVGLLWRLPTITGGTPLFPPSNEVMFWGSGPAFRWLSPMFWEEAAIIKDWYYSSLSALCWRGWTAWNA